MTTEKTFKPTEIGKIVNENLMSKGNKSLVFKSFVKSIDAKTGFVAHCLDQIPSDSDPKFFQSIIQVCNDKLNEAKEVRREKLLKEKEKIDKELKELE